MSLRKEGMSLRAIAAATGVGKSTIERDLAGVPPNQENGTPEVIDVDAEEDSGAAVMEDATLPQENVAPEQVILPNRKYTSDPRTLRKLS